MNGRFVQVLVCVLLLTISACARSFARLLVCSFALSYSFLSLLLALSLSLDNEAGGERFCPGSGISGAGPARGGAPFRGGGGRAFVDRQLRASRPGSSAPSPLAIPLRPRRRGWGLGVPISLSLICELLNLSGSRILICWDLLRDGSRSSNSHACAEVRTGKNT